MALNALRTSHGYGRTHADALVYKAMKRPRNACRVCFASIDNTSAICASFAINRFSSSYVVSRTAGMPSQQSLSVQYRYLSGNKDTNTASSTAAASTNKRKKRQNIKRQTALTKREKLISPTSTTKAEVDYPSELAGAIRERVTPTLQANVNTIRDYAKSFVSSDHPRAKRVGPKMDEKWWTVNIILALIPAALVALYCESQRGPMEEYFRSVREKERLRIMGEFGVNEEDEETAVMMARIDKLDIGEEEVKKSFSDRVVDAASSLYTYATSLHNEDGDENDSDESTEPDIEGSSSDDASQSPNHVAAESSDTAASGITAAAASGATATTDPSIATLIQRIEALEEQLGAKTATEEKNKRMRQHQLQYRLQRANQSGVQNRAEDRMIDEWRNDEKEKKRRQRADFDNAGKPPKFSLLELIKENARQKGQILMGYGIAATDALKDAAKDAFSMEQGAKIEADGPEPKADMSVQQDVSEFVSAVDQTSVAVQKTARLTQASIDALGEGNHSIAVEKVVEAATEANSAAQAALVAGGDASNITNAPPPPATEKRTNQGPIRRAGGWIRSILFRRWSQDNGTEGPDTA